MFTIHLNNLFFFSFHGIFEEEKILGNEFEVNASISFDDTEKIVSINQTIDYTKLYSIIKKRMDNPTPLLENLAQDIIQKIYETNKQIKSISISIKKLHPPIAAFIGTVGITCKKDF